MHETMETQKLKTKFVNRDVAIGGNKQILEFIAGVRFNVPRLAPQIQV